jgi:hypothetical protein
VYIWIDGGDFVNIATLKSVPKPEAWSVQFDGWDTLSHEQKSFLLKVIGDCAGEWWGAGRAMFWSRQAALEAITRTIALGATSTAPIMAA